MDKNFDENNLNPGWKCKSLLNAHSTYKRVLEQKRKFGELLRVQRSYTSQTNPIPVPLESVVCTDELNSRPSRLPDYRAESSAVAELISVLINSPRNILQKLVEISLNICRAGSAGVSLLRKDHGSKEFYWAAIAGALSPYSEEKMPCELGPSSITIERNSTQLFTHPERHFLNLLPVKPQIEEALLIPFHVKGKAAGTIWAISHDETRKFDAEDARLLTSLGRFAASAYQILESLNTSKQQGAEIKRDSDVLRETDRRKDEFLAMLAHELRNPLAPILNAVQLLQEADDDKQIVEYASTILKRQAGQMVRLVDDLLDVSRITSGKIELRRQRIELASVLNLAIEAARPLCKSLNHELTITLPAEPIYMDADPARLAQIVGNLLNNACKFTPEGGRIKLAVEREEAHAIIRVQDTGIGIAEDQLPNIFRMFTQIKSLERPQGGLGIGLSLVKSLVEMHEGTVEVRSPGLGKGSEFIVRLPIVTELPDSQLHESSPLKQAAVPRRILIVDDNQDLADSLSKLLKMSGNEVQTASDGLEGVETATRFNPDVVLLDIGLPKLNGYEVAQQIREKLQKPCFFIAITGWGQEADRHSSKEAGFDAHLVKPVDPHVLNQLLNRLTTN